MKGVRRKNRRSKKGLMVEKLVNFLVVGFFVLVFFIFLLMLGVIGVFLWVCWGLKDVDFNLECLLFYF